MIKWRLQRQNIKSIGKGDNNTEVWRKVKKKLGSLLGNKEDTEHRKQLAIARMNKYEKMWIKTTKVKQEVKRDFYNKFIIPVLPYK